MLFVESKSLISERPVSRCDSNSPRLDHVIAKAERRGNRLSEAGTAVPTVPERFGESLHWTSEQLAIIHRPGLKE
jgi:hypothetical protein